MHTAILLGAAEILQKNIDKLNGVIKLIFQPGEEVLPGGAKLILDSGVLHSKDLNDKSLNELQPQMIFAQHINSEENTGVFSVSKTAAMAATCEIYWTIKGKGTHAAQPHLGNDTILVAANIISFAQSFMTKYKNPLEQAVLSICSINGGNANNVFPNEVKMSGTLRTFDDAEIVNMKTFYLLPEFQRMGIGPNLAYYIASAKISENAINVFSETLNGYELSPKFFKRFDAENIGNYDTTVGEHYTLGGDTGAGITVNSHVWLMKKSDIIRIFDSGVVKRYQGFVK
ncbi:MAG: M20/M25/M40 family metallo-hydrolase [Alphaproteobacteria bacterium]|nr:M20/M25/M40 family metallo-hydrolase [Alphaproteobacteria bacterium]